jgi:PAS domain S-box-containing protein
MMDDLSKIKDVLKKAPAGMHIRVISEKLHQNRNSVARLLDILTAKGEVEIKVYGRSKVYYLTKPQDYKKWFELLSQTVEELNNFPPDGDIYTFVAGILKHLTPENTIIFFNSYDRNSKTIILNAIEGLGSRQPEIEAILCRPLNGLVFSVPDQILPELQTGECHEIPGGLTDLTFGGLPYEICKKIEAMPFFGKVYGIGVSWKGRLNGAITFILPKGAELESRDLITFFARQVAGFLSRRDAETELKEKEQFIREIIHNAKEGIVAYDRNLNYLVWNPFMESVTGISASEAIGKNAFGLFPHLREQGVDMLLERVLMGETIRSPDLPYHVPQTGKSGWVSGIYSPHVNGQGEIIGIIGNIRDITERKRVEEEVRQTRHNYETFFNRIDEFIFVLDEQGCILDTNKAVILRLGYTREELLGQQVLMLHPPELRDEAMRIMRELLAGARDSCPLPLLTRDGHLIPVESRVTKGEWDGKLVLFGVCKDLSELKISEEKFAAAFRSCAALMAISTQGKFIDVNETFLKTLGFSREEVVGKSISELDIFLQPEDRLHGLRMLEEGGDVRNLEVPVRTKDGSILYGLFSGDNIMIGDVPCLLTTMVDITEQKLLEKEMEFHEQEILQFSRSLNMAINKLNLLSSITRHDINNQLTVIMGYMDMLESEQRNPTLNSYFQTVATSAKRISTMIQFAKTYESIGTTDPVWQDIRTLVTTAAKEAPLGQIILKNDLSPGAEVFADPLIIKVFYNLMDNAIRYGGKITTIQFSVDEHDGVTVIVCEDDGDGVPQQEKEKIFERGYGKNTGLGLFLARDILNITGIAIRETGDSGKGARFELSVPRDVYRVTNIP